MSTSRLEDITWYVDERARAAGEPGIYHSYIASLATSLKHVALPRRPGIRCRASDVYG